MNFEDSPFDEQQLARNVSFCLKLKQQMVDALAVHLSSYGCTWDVGRALEKSYGPVTLLLVYADHGIR